MLRFVLASVIALALAISAHADERQYADAMFLEAVDLYMASKNAKDAKARLKELRLAHAALKQLVEQYPSSDVARRVQAWLGGGREVSLKTLETEIWQTGWSLCPQALNSACLLEFALTTAELAGDKNARDEVLMGMVETYAKTGDDQAALAAAKAIAVMQFIPSPLARMASAQAVVGNLKAALATAREIRDWNDRVRALASIIAASKGAANSEAYQEAVAAAMAAAKYVGYPVFLPQALEQIARAQATSGRFDDALTTAEQIDQLTESSLNKLAFALSHIAVAQAESGDVKTVQETIRKAIAVADRLEDRRARDGVYLQILHAQFAAGDLETAHATAEQLGEKFRSFALLLAYRAHMRAGDARSAQAVLESALDLAERETDTKARAESLAGIAYGLAETGEEGSSEDVVNAALDEAGRIDDIRERAAFLSRFATGMRAAGDLVSARHVAGALLQLVETVGEARQNPILLVWVVGHLADVGNASAALAVTAQIGDVEDRIRALIKIAEALPNQRAQ